MSNHNDRQILERYQKSFTSEQSTEFARRARRAQVLLVHALGKCEELAAKIKDQRSEEKQIKRAYQVILAVGAVWWALRVASIVTSDVVLYFLVPGFVFLILRQHFSPNGAYGLAISTLKIIAFSTIIRIEELGANERYVFLWIKERGTIEKSLLKEIYMSYLSSEHTDEHDDSIDVEGDLDPTDGVDTHTRILLEIARAVVN